MNDAEITELKSGDVILIERGSRSYLRTVIEGPADCTESETRQFATVPIMRRSWTKRVHTVLDRHFLRMNATVTGIRAKKLMGGDELSRLIDMGFNVSKEIVREVKEAADSKRRRAQYAYGDLLIRHSPKRCQALTQKLLKAATEYRTLKTL